MEGIAYSPVEEQETLRTRPVPVFWISIVALGITAPVWSTTLPDIWAFVAWAFASLAGPTALNVKNNIIRASGNRTSRCCNSLASPGHSHQLLTTEGFLIWTISFETFQNFEHKAIYNLAPLSRFFIRR